MDWLLDQAGSVICLFLATYFWAFVALSAWLTLVEFATGLVPR